MRPLDPRLLSRTRAARRHVALSASLAAVSAALVVVQALLAAWMVGSLVAHGEVLGSPHLGGDWLVAGTSTGAGLLSSPAARGFAALTVVLVLRAVVAWTQERFAQRAAARTVAELREQVVTHAVAHGPRRDDDGVGHAGVATLATQGLDGLEPYLTKYLPSLLTTAIVTPAVLLVIAGLDWVSLLIALGTLPLVPLFMWLVGTMTEGASERRLRAAQRLGAQVLDLLAGLPTLRAFGRELGPAARVRALGEASARATLQTLRFAFLSGMVLELLTTLSVAVVAVSVGLRLVGGGLSLEIGLAVIMLAPEVYLPLRAVGAQFHASANGLAAADAAFAVLDAPLPDDGPRLAGGAATPHGGPGVPRALVLDDVSVKAGDRSLLAPCALSARIELTPGHDGRGRVVALRGPSGAGKSTTVELLLGLLRPDRGQVLVEHDDGGTTPLHDTDLAAWWRHVVWVPQRPTIPPGTLRDVVAGPRGAGDAALTDVALAEAARTTGLDTVLDTLPSGWDTQVGLGGAGLSVGQRQRVALTAALLTGADRQALVLDEPTAHLDAAGEQVVLHAVRSWRDSGRTVIAIAHRHSLLALADQVIDVDSGAPAPESDGGPTPSSSSGLPASNALPSGGEPSPTRSSGGEASPTPSSDDESSPAPSSDHESSPAPSSDHESSPAPSSCAKRSGVAGSPAPPPPDGSR